MPKFGASLLSWLAQFFQPIFFKSKGEGEANDSSPQNYFSPEDAIPPQNLHSLA